MRLASFGFLSFFSALSLVPAQSGDVESRTFAILVDGKRAGEERMRIERHADGRTIVTDESDVTVRVLLYTFRYNYRGQETWQNGRLTRLESACNDDGKRYTVHASTDGEGLRVRVNGRERRGRADLWPASYWKLPEALKRGGAVAVLEPDNGQESAARLQPVGEEQLTVAGTSQKVVHYRLLGKTAADLWFDANDRLVRHEWSEEGHRTVRELSRIEPQR